MLSTLLQVTPNINGMSDVTFTLGNLITIGGGALATATAFFKLQYDQKSETKATIVRFATMEKDHSKEVEKLNGLFLQSQKAKRDMKAELLLKIEKESEISMKRIDKTQSEMKEYSNKSDAEFKEINSKLDQIIGFSQNKQ